MPLPANAPAALRALLLEYDRANRLEIDALYAQFSPTLDDYYAEDLRVEFPRSKPDLSRDVDVRPELALTRTVPGQEPRSVRAPGAPFPLSRAVELLASALALAPRSQGEHTWTPIDGNLTWLRPEQVGRSQVVHLVLEPGGRDALEIVDELYAPPAR